MTVIPLVFYQFTVSWDLTGMGLELTIFCKKTLQVRLLVVLMYT